MTTFSEMFYARKGNGSSSVKTTEGFKFKLNQTVGTNPTDVLVTQRIKEEVGEIKVSAPKSVTPAGSTVTDTKTFTPADLADTYARSTGVKGETSAAPKTKKTKTKNAPKSENRLNGKPETSAAPK